MKEFEPTTPNGFTQKPKNTTTLVIENMPSEIGYELITEAIIANGTFDKDEIMKKINQKINNETGCILLDNAEFETVLKSVVHKTVLLDSVDFDCKKDRRYPDDEEDFDCKQERGDLDDEYDEISEKEEVDEYGRTPYIRRIIEEVKEEMRQNSNNETKETRQSHNIEIMETPTPPPHHM